MVRDGQECEKRERQTAKEGREILWRERQMARAVMNSEDMIRLRWERNRSVRYDGKTQDVTLKFIVPKDKNATAGKTVHVRWGRQSRVWKAVVVGLEADLESRKRAATPELVPEAKKQQQKTKGRLHHSLMSTGKVNEVNYTECIYSTL